MYKFQKILIRIVVTSATLVLWPVSQIRAVLNTFDVTKLSLESRFFEGGSKSENLDNWETDKFCCSHSVQVVNSPV